MSNTLMRSAITSKTVSISLLLLPAPCSLLPAPCSLFPVPCSLCYI
ncbi:MULTISPECIES: hypothetical protein [Moorena]|nr:MULTISPECIES: hypothetical protein [Moorena]NEO70067.1 hypothetical protein [Moorena sp. SIO3H5]